MKQLFKFLPKLVAVAAVALSFSSCNRAEYAMLPKTTPYHATYGTIKSVPAPAEADKEQASKEVATVEVAETPKNVASQPATAAKAQAPRATTSAAASTVTKATAPAAHKLNLVQKLGVAKALKQVDKATSKMQFKQRSETAGTSRIEGKLRQGLILILVGLLVGLLGSIGGVIGNIFAVVGSILFIIGVVLIILYLLDEL